ncbi:dTDP-4-dehydrorhamnose reductase [Jiella sonneratiae]|uniref:dTDP-4-dehydrorhamnose reductase n=1 Tax=Jiella sonneratiae TaxID=2816856 RepID=A0ABS3J5U2_9HYPH|nr:dTDP-4-dehydrorhamnose reductase [Jiella sonneratiae]MBO0905054.1 dTDP-4-dehydrorhamnose reductase [Jiella sonneratiae]
MRILVTGRDGQVARCLADLADDRHAITCLGRPELDLTDRASVEAAIAHLAPAIVVNPAAYTAVDKAESEREAAFAVNAAGAENVAAAAAAAGIPIVHLSTDYVFAGDKDGPYVESDATGPTGVYGASKLEGERLVLAANPKAVVLRTAWVYSPYGNNFLKTMLRVATDRDVLRVVADQRGTPTYAPDIAAGILAVCDRLAAEPEGVSPGTYHMVASGETTWAGFAEAIFAASKARGGPFAAVEKIATADYPTPARRPANSRLDPTRFQTVFGHALPEWKGGVDRCLSALAASA